MNTYSILIPIHNEIRYIETLLKKLDYFNRMGHEIIIIDDGSDDGSEKALNGQKGIVLVSLPKNTGKGYALREGLAKASNDRIIVYDGDLELDPSDISKLMILNKDKNIRYAMGFRFNSLNPSKSKFDWGNFMFTSFFNIIFMSCHKDILCCAKSFHLNDLNNYHILSKGFDIDMELSAILTLKNKNKSIPQIRINYKRRNFQEGKKLKVSDGWSILSRLFSVMKYF